MNLAIFITSLDLVLKILAKQLFTTNWKDAKDANQFTYRQINQSINRSISRSIKQFLNGLSGGTTARSTGDSQLMSSRKTSWTAVSWGGDRWNVVNDSADVWRSFHVCWPTTRKVCCTTNITLLETEIYLSIHWRPYSIRSLYVSCNAIKQFVFVSTTFEMLLLRDIWFFHIGLVVFLFNFFIFIAIRIVSCFFTFFCSSVACMFFVLLLCIINDEWMNNDWFHLCVLCRCTGAQVYRPITQVS